jgi:uncharacterized protein YjbI with pentapeptide repeats
MHTIPNRPSRVLHFAALFPLVACAGAARADIFQWEYINPADPSQGKQQSTTLAPGGAGVDAIPGADLQNRNLTMAYLIGADLTRALGYYANLTNADLSQANLTNANFDASTMTGADLTDANVGGANFGIYSFNVCGVMGNCIISIGTGITPPQLYSTASYQAHDLSGIVLSANDLTGGNFAGQNLTNASFYHATLTGANLNQANLTNVDF